MSLTGREQAFVQHYRADPKRNATRAAIAAGYSEKTAEAAASRLLRNVKVRERIRELDGPVLAKHNLTAERVLQEIARLCFVDPRKFFRADGSAVPITELDDETAAALAGIEIAEEFHDANDEDRPGERDLAGYTKKFRFASKVDALKLAGMALKLFSEGANRNPGDGELSALTDADLERIILASNAAARVSKRRRPKPRKSRRRR